MPQLIHTIGDGWMLVLGIALSWAPVIACLVLR